MKEEDIIRQHDTGRNPFRTPERYFDDFTERLMARLPEVKPQAEPERPRVVRLPLMRRLARYAAAAMLTGAVLGIGTYYYQRDAAQADALLLAEQQEYSLSAEDLDDALDYAMVDNEEIAYYLTEAY